MTANKIELGRDPKIATDDDGTNTHTLSTVAGTSNNNPSFVEWGRNPILATDVDGAGVHSLKTISV